MTSANPVSTPICPGCSEATVAVAALPITAPNQAGSSRAGAGWTASAGRPSFAIARVSQHVRRAPGHRPGARGSGLHSAKPSSSMARRSGSSDPPGGVDCDGSMQIKPLHGQGRRPQQQCGRAQHRPQANRNLTDEVAGLRDDLDAAHRALRRMIQGRTLLPTRTAHRRAHNVGNSRTRNLIVGLPGRPKRAIRWSAVSITALRS